MSDLWIKKDAWILMQKEWPPFGATILVARRRRRKPTSPPREWNYSVVKVDKQFKSGEWFCWQPIFEPLEPGPEVIQWRRIITPKKAEELK